MKKIAILNQKGGTGKTTSTINIAGELAQSGYKVLIIDADSQGNSSSNLGLYDPDGKTLATFLMDTCSLEDVIINTNFKGIDIITSNLELQFAEIQMLKNTTRNDVVLKKKLTSIEDKYDFVIVDCSPSLSSMTINVLTYVDYLLIPIKADKNSLEGIGRLMDVVSRIKEDSNENLSILGIFITAYEKGISFDKYIYELCTKDLNEYFINIPIGKNVSIREAPNSCQPICIYAPKSSGCHDYRLLTLELLKRMGVH